LLRKIFLILALSLISVSSAYAVDSNEITDLKNNRKYIFLLVHGITSSFDDTYNVQKNKWIADPVAGHTALSNKKVNFYEYLRSYLNLKGRVFGYSFSNPFGHPKYNARELGDPDNHFEFQSNKNFFSQNNKTSTDNINQVRNSKSSLELMPLNPLNSSSSPEYIIQTDPYTGITANYYVRFNSKGSRPALNDNEPDEVFIDQFWFSTGIEKLPESNNWFKQARRDYAKENFNDPELRPLLIQDISKNTGKKISLIEAELNGKTWQYVYDRYNDVIPNQFIVIAHSLGNLAVRTYMVSDFYQGNIAKVISLDGVHLGSDMADAKNFLGGPLNYYSLALFQELYGQMKGFRKDVYPILRNLAFGYYLWSFLSNPKPPDDDELAMFAVLLDLMILDDKQNSDGSPDFEPRILYGTLMRGAGHTLVATQAGEYLDGGDLAMLPWENYKDAPNLLDSYELKNKISWAQNQTEFENSPPGYKGIPGYEINETFVGWLKNKNLNARYYDKPNEYPRWAMVSAVGFPTPHKELSRKLEFLSFFPYLKLIVIASQPEFKELPTMHMKFQSMLLSLIEPNIVFANDGSLVVPHYSSKGTNVEIINKSKAYGKVFEYDEIYLSADLEANMALYRASLGIAQLVYAIAGPTAKPIFFLPAITYFGLTYEYAKSNRSISSTLLAGAAAGNLSSFGLGGDVKKAAYAHQRIFEDVTKTNYWAKKFYSDDPNLNAPNIILALADKPGISIRNVQEKLKEQTRTFELLGNLATGIMEYQQFELASFKINGLVEKYKTEIAVLGTLEGAALLKFSWDQIINVNAVTQQEFQNQLKDNLKQEILNQQNNLIGKSYKYREPDFAHNRSVSTETSTGLSVDLFKIIDSIGNMLNQKTVSRQTNIQQFVQFNINFPKNKKEDGYYLANIPNTQNNTTLEDLSLINEYSQPIFPVAESFTTDNVDSILSVSMLVPPANAPNNDKIEIYSSKLDLDYEGQGDVDPATGAQYIAFDYLGKRSSLRPKSINLKTDKMIIHGRVDDLFPKNMRQTEYSLNFGPWTHFEIKDAFGNFSVGPLPLAEGQNIITFRMENIAGKKNWQMMRVIRSSTPLLPSAMVPDHQKSTSQNPVQISVQYNDTQFEPQDVAGQIIHLEEFKIDDVLVPSDQIELTVTWNAYKYTADIKTTQNLSEGEHTIVAKAFDIYNHSSYARWNFTVDHTAPLITIEGNDRYTNVSSANIALEYIATDNLSSFIYDVNSSIQNNLGQIVTTFNSQAYLSIGKQIIQWDGMSRLGPPIKAPDGIYTLIVSATDKAGNLSIVSKNFYLDSSTPKILTATFDHSLMSTQYNSLNLNLSTSEKSKVIIAFTQEGTDLSHSYMLETTESNPGEFKGSFSWKFESEGNSIPDGTYLVKLIPIDDVYLQGDIITANVIIDRTGPIISNAHSMPLVLGNTGSSPYQGILKFNLDENSPLNLNKKVYANIELVYKETQNIIKTWNNYAVVATSNSLSFDLNNSSLPKGVYEIRITAWDPYFNKSLATAQVIKDGVPPIVDFPKTNDTITDKVTLIGIAQDPDWTNNNDFENYEVFIAIGNQTLPSQLNSLDLNIWKTDAVAVPLANQKDYSKPNLSVRPQSYSGPIAILDTQNLPSGSVTVLITTSEKGLGRTSATIKKLLVNKTLVVQDQRPLLDLVMPTRNIQFSNLEKIPFTILNSNAPAHIEIDIFDSINNPIHHLAFQNVPGNPYFGKPDILYGQQAGLYFWEDELGFHLVLNGDKTINHFNGSLVAGGITNVSHNAGTSVSFNDLINFDVTLNANEFKKIDFQITNRNLKTMISFMHNDDFPKASLLKLGKAQKAPVFIPAMFDLKTPDESTLKLSWDGKNQAGGFGPSGIYRIKVSASGINGIGFSETSATFNVQNQFELKIGAAIPSDKKFDPFANIDRISIPYFLNKEAYVTAKVIDAQSGSKIITLLNNQKQISREQAYNLTWNGIYPNIYSQSRKVSGDYAVILSATASDSSENITITINGIQIISGSNGTAIAELNPQTITQNYQGSQVLSAYGDSSYFWSMFATGKYYPPKGFNYELQAFGTQNVKINPYVPFAGLAHRYFDKVKIKAEIYIQYSWHKQEFKDCFWGIGNCDKKPIVRNENPVKMKIGTQDNQYYNLHTNSVCTRNPLISYAVDDCTLFSPATLTKLSTSNEEVSFGFENSYSGYAPYVDDIQEHYITVKTNDGVVLDTIYPLRMNPPCTYGQCTATSEKGIFKAELNLIGTGDQGGTAYFRYNTKIKLEQPIVYSRLTNRFVPWYGYVHKDIAHQYDFHPEFNNANGLGFLGLNQMNGITSIPPAYDPNLFPGTQTDALTKINSFENLFKNFEQTWVTADPTYVNYLEGDHFEFIPITTPLNGGFVSMNSVSTSLNTFWRVYTHHSQDMDLKWPITYEETESLNNQQILAINELKKQKDIEVFDLVNPHYQIDLNTVSYAKLGESFVPMNGGVYKKEGYTSPKLSEIFNLPNNVKQNTVSVLITKNIDSSIALSFNNNQIQTNYLSDSPVKAKYSGSFTPVDWSSDLDPLLPNGVLESKAKIFNEIDFSSLSAPLPLASEYPFNLQNDLTFTGPHLFYKHDRNNIYSGQILNPNIEYDPWRIQIYDVAGSLNTSLVVTQMNQDPGQIMNNQFKVKLKLDAVEKRFVKVEGKASGPYELVYFDGQNWQTINSGTSAAQGILGYWNVSRLSGKVTLALRVSENNQITTQTKDIYIGQLIRPNEPVTANLSVPSPYKRAVVHFHPKSFDKDTFVSVTPVDLKELKLETLPDIQSIGPIAEILPHGSTFNNGLNGTEDTRPTLVFQYSLGDIQELSGMGVDVKKLNVYYINESGGLDLADNVHSWSPSADRYLITAKLDHFSPYALLDGEIYPKPTLHASQKNVRTDQIQVYGKADPNRKLIIYLDDDPIFGDRDIKKITSIEKVTSLAEFVLKSRKPGSDYLNYLTPEEKTLIQKQRDDAKLFNNQNLQTEQLLEAQWQTEYETLQQNQINRLNKAINYILDQSIFNESTPVTTSITFTYLDENGVTQTTSNIVLIDPKLFDEGDRFSTRNIIFLSEINTDPLTNNYHIFRPMKAIDYSILNKKIIEAKEDYVLQGNGYQSFTTQTDNQGNYLYPLRLSVGVTQNHIFVTYDTSSVAKNRAIGHLLVGFDQSAPAIVSASITPDFINHDSQQTIVAFNVEISEYGKIGLNRFNTNGKLIDTQFLEGSPFEVNKTEWTFSEGDPDGDYAYSLFMIDESGNTSLPVEGKIILDRRPPQILENNTLQAFNPINSSFNVNLKTSEPITKMALSIKNQSGVIIYEEITTKAPFVFNFSPSVSSDATYTYRTIVFDRGLNSALVTGSFSLDTTAPETPQNLKLTHAFDQIFIESDFVSDNSLLGYSLFLRKSPTEISKEIELKPTPQYLVKKPARDQFLYYAIKATDIAYNQSVTTNEKAVYSEADAVFKVLTPTANEILLQDQLQLGIPSNADTKENYYVVHHLKSKNYRPAFAYSGFNPISDYYRAEVAYPRNILSPLPMAFEYNPAIAQQYNLTAAQIKIFRYDGLHWIPVANSSVSGNKIVFDQTQLGYYVQTLPGVTLFSDHNGPQIKFERLANNNLVPENLMITANLTDNDTAIDPSSFKLTVDSKQYLIPSSYFVFKDQYGREGTLIVSIPAIMGSMLTEGRHLISIECKDLAGNTSVKTIEVKHLKSFAVENPLNYPNPILKGTSTKLSFQLSQAADQIIIRIYSTTGRLVKEINAGPALVGYNEVPWDVRDNWGDYLANDVYLYTVIAKSNRGETVRAQGKLVVVK